MWVVSSTCRIYLALGFTLSLSFVQRFALLAATFSRGKEESVIIIVLHHPFIMYSTGI